MFQMALGFCAWGQYTLMHTSSSKAWALIEENTNLLFTALIPTQQESEHFWNNLHYCVCDLGTWEIHATLNDDVLLGEHQK